MGSSTGVPESPLGSLSLSRRPSGTSYLTNSGLRTPYLSSDHWNAPPWVDTERPIYAAPASAPINQPVPLVQPTFAPEANNSSPSNHTPINDSNVRYTLLSGPSSRANMTSSSDVSAPTPHARRWGHYDQCNPPYPRMSGTGGGYGYISGSFSSGMSMNESEGNDYFGSRPLASEASEVSSNPSAPSANQTSSDEPLKALQRLTVDLHNQKHSAPPVLDPEVLSESSVPTSPRSRLLSSSEISDGEAGPLPSPVPKSRTSSQAPQAQRYSKLPTPMGEETVLPASPLDDAMGQGHLTLSPNLTEGRLSLEPPPSSTAAGLSPPISHRSTASPTIQQRFSSTPVSPPPMASHHDSGSASRFSSTCSPRLHIVPRKRREVTSDSDDEWVPPSLATRTKRARRSAQPTTHVEPHAVRNRTRKRWGSMRVATPETDGQPSDRASPPADAAPAGRNGGSHTTSTGFSICDYVHPLDGSYCGQPFRRLYDLVRHRASIHAKDEAKAVRKGLMFLDQARVWGKEVDPKTSDVGTEWRCTKCHSVFSRKDALLRHRRIRSH